MGIVDLIYPKTCVGCRRAGKYVCEECWEKVERAEAICPSCGRVSPSGWRHAWCEGGIERLVAPYRYRGVLQKMIKMVKYKNSWGVVDRLFELEFKQLGNTLHVTRDTIVTAAPMYRLKARERGFNQAERLARMLVESLRGDSLKVEYREMLVRVRRTRPQYGLSREERAENMERAFKINVHQTQMLNVHQLILLVDDVWTTGSTMKECARELNKAGAQTIWGVVLAR